MYTGTWFCPSAQFIDDERFLQREMLLTAFAALEAIDPGDCIHRRCLLTWVCEKCQVGGRKIPTVAALQRALNLGFEEGYFWRTGDESGFYSLTDQGREQLPNVYGTYSYPTEPDPAPDEERLFLANKPFAIFIDTKVNKHRLELAYRGNLEGAEFCSIRVDGRSVSNAPDALEIIGIPRSEWSGSPADELFNVAFRLADFSTKVSWMPDTSIG